MIKKDIPACTSTDPAQCVPTTHCTETLRAYRQAIFSESLSKLPSVISGLGQTLPKSLTDARAQSARNLLHLEMSGDRLTRIVSVGKFPLKICLPKKRSGRSRVPLLPPTDTPLRFDMARSLNSPNRERSSLTGNTANTFVL